MNDSLHFWRRAGAALVLAAAVAGAGAQRARNGDYIVAIVNQELVTAGEIDRRIERAREDASRAGQRLPADAELRKQVLDLLIDERVIVTYARESGVRIDDTEVDRAVQGVAQQNQLTLPKLRERLRSEGIDYARFRAQLRDQMMIERVREREVYQRIKVDDAEIDRVVERQRTSAKTDGVINLAQILVAVPEGADEATVGQRQAKAAAALLRVRGGEDFAAVAKELSDDGNREKGGEIGLRPVSRLPDVFVDAVRGLNSGEITPRLLRSGAGFHVLKVIERKDGGGLRVTQTHARHILLRTSAELNADTAARRLNEYKRQIEGGSKRFEDIARQFSEDGSAASGGDLGWAAPGAMVPEFEEAMNKLPPGGLSAPVVSRFGVHLIQVLERRDVNVDPKQLREQARNVLREQKFESAYNEWAQDLRARAYVEMREPPQ
jgi:peptidyl-prolyl cis-trans isomerase SurA